MEKLKVGRKRIPDEEKKRLASVYVTLAEKKKIVEKYGSLTAAVKSEILPKI